MFEEKINQGEFVDKMQKNEQGFTVLGSIWAYDLLHSTGINLCILLCKNLIIYI